MLSPHCPRRTDENRVKPSKGSCINCGACQCGCHYCGMCHHVQATGGHSDSDCKHAVHVQLQNTSAQVVLGVSIIMGH